MSKKEDLLKREQREYPLSDEEMLEVASLSALIQQAQAAQDFIYKRIIQNVADRLEITGKELTLNFDEILEKGAKNAKLIAKD